MGNKGASVRSKAGWTKKAAGSGYSTATGIAEPATKVFVWLLGIKTLISAESRALLLSLSLSAFLAGLKRLVVLQMVEQGPWQGNQFDGRICDLSELDQAEVQGRRIVVFVVGGITRSEMRVAHLLSKKLGRDIVLGGTSLDEPEVFLKNLLVRHSYCAILKSLPKLY